MQCHSLPCILQSLQTQGGGNPSR